MKKFNKFRFYKTAVSLLFMAVFTVSNSLSVVNALDAKQKALINKNILYYDLVACQIQSASGSEVDLNSADNLKNVFLFMKGQGLSDVQAAAVVGNISRESGGDPQNIQDPGGRSKDPNDAGGAGWGLIQWTPGSKIIGIADSMKINGPIYELETQLKIVWGHMGGTSPTGVTNMLAGFKKITDITAAVTDYEERMEGAGVPAIPERVAAAKIALKAYGGQTGDPATPTASASSDAVGANCECTANNKNTETDAANLDEVIKKLANENGGQTKISVRALEGSAKGESEGGDQVPTRSSYKIYTAYATLRAIEDGKIDWDTKIWGGKSVDETMQQMIINSNNDAAEALRTDSRIGSPAKVTAMLQKDLGLSENTVMGSGDASAPSGTNSKSTANDFTKFLTMLYKKDLPGVKKDSSYSKLLAFMKKATTDGSSARDGIAAGVGNGTEVADKPGWASGGTDPASNDVGIVYLKNKPYVMAILTDKPNKWDGVAKIAKGINEVMTGLEGGGENCANDGAVSGDLQGTVMAYAYPEYHPPPYVKARKAYEKAYLKAKAEGQYIGGLTYQGIDCGGFVTRLLLDSGYEPRYNYSGDLSKGAGNTLAQEKWMKENWQKIDPKSTKDQEPGDVAINDHHTYVYVGKIEGFGSVIASASLDERAPMAGHEAPAATDFNWYRKK